MCSETVAALKLERKSKSLLKPTGANRLEDQQGLRDSIFEHFRIALKPEDTDFHWKRLLRHHRQHVRSRGNKADLRTSAFDYFLNEVGLIVEPLIVEKQSLAATEQLAYSDHLTGLYNYAYFSAEIEMEVARALRYKTGLCLLLMDLDGFKQVNDRFGHLTGNEILKHVGSLLRTGLRASDLVARFGGDEFAILLHQADITTGLRIASSLCASVQKRFGLPTSPRRHPKVTVSLGLSALPEQSDSARTLFQKADEALYHTKRVGGNGYSYLSNGSYVYVEGRKGGLALQD